MSRHFVAFVIEYEFFDDNKDVQNHFAVYSGFILSLHDQWYWVTAGHCLRDDDGKKGIEDLYDLAAAGRIRMVRVGLADYFGPDVHDRNIIPFAYESG